MEKIKILALFLSLTVGVATGQQMSDQWYLEKNASWERTRAQFPESSYAGTFQSRMVEIDGWAKEKDTDLYYNSNKPYLLAQLVQKEIDELAVQQQQAVNERLRVENLQRAAAQQQAERTEGESAGGNSQSSQAPTTSTQRWMSEKKQGEVFEHDPNLSAIIGRHDSPNLTAMWIGSIVVVSLASLVAWGLYRLIRPRHGVASASSLGRKWAAWMVAIGTISMLPSFFRKLDGDTFALWAVGVVGWGILAFFVGWIIGLIKYRSRKSLQTNEIDSSTQRDDAVENISHKYEFFNNLPEPQSPPEEPKIQSTPPIMKTTEFEVIVPEGKDLNNGYVEMIHLRQYSLLLKNHRHVRCDAMVVIDGINVGTWRINSRGEIRIERPAHDSGHFTFFEVGTPEAKAAAIGKDDKNGLVSVTFWPEIVYDGLRAAELPDEAGHRAGATGLTGQSEQKFMDAGLIKHDTAREFTIHIRLVSARPDIRPLAPRSTPIPPPVN